MEVIVADVLGYCMGVRRAMEKAVSALDFYSQKEVYSLGPLIHNQAALNFLAEKGLKIVEEEQISSIKNGSVVIIRAHGVCPQVLQELNQKECVIIDATCPRVLASQKNVQKFSKKGFKIVLAGDKNHGEVKGIQGYAGKNFALIENSSDAQSFVFEKSDESSLFLSQTTFSPSEFEKISEILLKKNPSVKIMNTICPATKERQDSLIRLCPKVEGVLIVGGKNSANTKRLFETAKNLCKNAKLIENYTEIPKSFFKLKSVGITAGASTPDSVILEVKSALQKS